jgi:hypothetical protein
VRPSHRASIAATGAIGVDSTAVGARNPMLVPTRCGRDRCAHAWPSASAPRIEPVRHYRKSPAIHSPHAQVNRRRVQEWQRAGRRPVQIAGLVCCVGPRPVMASRVGRRR